MLRQCSSAKVIPPSGDRSDNRPLPVRCPRNPGPSIPVNARTGEMSVTLSVTGNQNCDHAVLDDRLVPCHPFRRSFPSNPGFNSISFLLTASICCSAGRACVALTHAWNSGVSQGFVGLVGEALGLAVVATAVSGCVASSGRTMRKP